MNKVLQANNFFLPKVVHRQNLARDKVFRVIEIVAGKNPRSGNRIAKAQKKKTSENLQSPARK